MIFFSLACAILTPPAPVSEPQSDRRGAHIASAIQREFKEAKNLSFRYRELNTNKHDAYVIAYIEGSDICGTGGCRFLILHKTKRGYAVVSTVFSARYPVLYNGPDKFGYPKFLAWVEGGGITEGYYAELFADGKRYPSNPTVTRKASSKVIKKSTRILSESSKVYRIR